MDRTVYIHYVYPMCILTCLRTDCTVLHCLFSLNKGIADDYVGLCYFNSKMRAYHAVYLSDNESL